MVRKNTLSYAHHWTVIDTETGDKIGEYKTEKLAKAAFEYVEILCGKNSVHGWWDSSRCIDRNRKIFEKYAIENVRETAIEHMKRPCGDPQPKPKRHSNRRLVELN